MQKHILLIFKKRGNFTLSIVQEKLINVRPIFGLARHLSFQVK